MAFVVEADRMSDDVAVRLGQALKQARTQVGMTGAELARQLTASGRFDKGVPVQNVYRWESGERPLSLATIELAEGIMKLRAGTILRLAGYVDDGDLIDVGTLPPWAQRPVRAILKDADRDKLVGSNGEDGA